MISFFKLCVGLTVVICVLQILTCCSGNSHKDDCLENFDQLDEKKWQVNENTFPDCGSTMTKESVTTNGANLILTIDQNPVDSSGRKYTGGEIGSVAFFSYGTYTTRIKNNIAPGTVSSFFLMNKWKKTKWEHQEIDIEFLGKAPTKVQFTVHYLNPQDNNHITHMKVYDLGFDSSEDFNEYGIHWTKDSICWLVNGAVVHVETNNVPDTVMQIRMNHWTGNDQVVGMKNWLGKIDDRSLPSQVYYDWICYKPLD